MMMTMKKTPLTRMLTMMGYDDDNKDDTDDDNNANADDKDDDNVDDRTH
jgi:uncharacterized protein with PIN domain